MINGIEDQILGKLDKSPWSATELAQDKSNTAQLLEDGTRTNDAMIMQYLLNSTLLHDEVFFHLLLAQLLLCIYIEPVPHRVPEIALIYIGLV